MAKGRNDNLCFHLHPYFVYVSNGGSSESSLLDNVISSKISGAGHALIHRGGGWGGGRGYGPPPEKSQKYRVS